MKLYEIEWSGTCYVVAEDEAAAVKVAMKAQRDYSATEIGLEASPVAPGRIDSNWTRSLPFGAPDDRTCEEWAREQK